MKKNMRKFAGIVLSTLLATSIFTGCTTTSESGSTSTGSSDTATETQSEDYPTKPVTLIVPFGAGGGADIIARVFERLAPEYLGQPLVIVNKAGGGGAVATAEYLSEDADGYTLLFGSSATFTSQPLMNDVTYSAESFEPIMGLVSMGNLLAVNPDLGVTTLDELVEKYSQEGNSLTYGIPATGSVNHLVQAQLFEEAGINNTALPFASNNEVLSALLGGHIDIAALSTTELKELHKSGDVIVLGTYDEKRLEDPDLADIPTIKEQGYDITMTVWRMLFAQNGTPDDVTAKIYEAFTAMMNDPEFVEFAKSQDLTIDMLTGEEVVAKIDSEYATTEELYKTLKIGKFQ